MLFLCLSGSYLFAFITITFFHFTMFILLLFVILLCSLFLVFSPFQDDFSKIFVHIKELAIKERSVVVRRNNGSTIGIRGHSYNIERDFYMIHLKEPLPLYEELALEIR